MIEQLKNINFSSIIELLAYDVNNPLLFNTGLFMFLFLGFLLIYQLTKRAFKLNCIFVILFSLYFYYKSSEYYCLIMLAICFSDYVIGRLLGNTQSVKMRKFYVALNVISNISILLYCNIYIYTIKYTYINSLVYS